MLNANPYQQYQENAVKSAPPGELTLKLYDGAVKFIKRGMQAIEDKNLEAANNAIVRAQDIISYLMDTLNPAYEIAHQLMSLYEYMNRRLVEANVKKDREILQEVLGLLEELRDAWREAVRKTGGIKQG